MILQRIYLRMRFNLAQQFIYLHLLLFITGCIKKEEPLFRLVSPESSGLTFINEISEDEYFNVLTNEYIYNGAGVGIGDFNNDGLQDIFFSGNMVANHLYLNKGDFEFEDVSKQAKIEAHDRWSTGVVVADVNGDGWLDVYVCATNFDDPERRRNNFFVNLGLDEKGIPVFMEKAAEYGIDDDGFSTNAAFFDYDNDNDLDLYVLTNFLDVPIPNRYRPRKMDGSSLSNDRFYRNNGDGTFTNATIEAGIRYEGYGLGISILDFNNDGWRDMYITNDYLSSDLLYINNQDGTFSNKIGDYLKHQTHSAMGHDIADINNDGWPDIFTLDMLPADNENQKRMHAMNRYINYALNEEHGYEYPYKRNMLQLNNGPDAYGNHYFSEIGLYAGIYASDWSWSPLLADFDNDGFRDLFISNGYPKDVTDLDYATTNGMRSMSFSNEEELAAIPVRYMSNYLYRNNGDLTFTNKAAEWGLKRPSFSHGSAYVDLDNDGDLDLVSNNMNEPALVYENKLYDSERREMATNFLRLNLLGNNQIQPFGSKVYIFYGDSNIQYNEYSPFRGYRSTVEPFIHFGLGDVYIIDSLIIIWPDGISEKRLNIQANQNLTIKYNRAGNTGSSIPVLIDRDPENYLFSEVSGKTNLTFKHVETPFDDYRIQPNLPHQLSQSGPGISAGDVDNDGEVDLFIGGAVNESGTIFMQSKGSFFPVSLEKHVGKTQEDLGSLLFDVENDGDLDLYVVSGGNEKPFTLKNYQDRLYENDGKGNFTKSTNALPDMLASGSCVKAADYDNDGDLDLFIGGRNIPGRYPTPASSYILNNESSPGNLKFTDVSEDICPSLNNIGMVTDGIWTDFDNDSHIDLILVGEWMPVTVFKNMEGKFKDVTSSTGINNKIGWWNSLAGGDFDNDGDIDYVAGNLGLNSIFKASMSEPVISYSSDYDNNGTYDLVIANFIPDFVGQRKPYPIHYRLDMGRQLELMNKRFPKYESYGEATIDELLTDEEKSSALKLEATYFKHSYIENLGNGNFKIIPLPQEAQIAPLYGIRPGDYNDDEFLDLLVVGNGFDALPFWGRMDAMNGLLLIGDGHGNFSSGLYPETGFLVSGDAKAIIQIPTPKSDLFVISQNQDSLRVFERKTGKKLIKLDPNNAWGEIILKNGDTRKQEFYYGNTYLSQSARFFRLPAIENSYKIFDFSGVEDNKK